MSPKDVGTVNILFMNNNHMVQHILATEFILKTDGKLWLHEYLTDGQVGCEQIMDEREGGLGNPVVNVIMNHRPLTIWNILNHILLRIWRENLRELEWIWTLNISQLWNLVCLELFINPIEIIGVCVEMFFIGLIWPDDFPTKWLQVPHHNRTIIKPLNSVLVHLHYPNITWGNTPGVQNASPDSLERLAPYTPQFFHLIICLCLGW